MEIVKHPDPILLRKAEQVAHFDSAYLSDLRNDMQNAMIDNHGQGLAANQIGIDLAVALVHVRGYGPLFLINPVITRVKGEEEKEEGCLSIPGEKFIVKRATTIWITYQEINGFRVTAKVKGELAQCIQHECDHLEGITIKERSDNANVLTGS